MSRGPLPPVTDFEVRVANRLMAVREARKMTQTELAAAAGMSQHQVSRIERGTQRLHLVYLEQLAKALRVPVPQLLSPDPIRVGSSTICV